MAHLGVEAQLALLDAIDSDVRINERFLRLRHLTWAERRESEATIARLTEAKQWLADQGIKR